VGTAASGIRPGEAENGVAGGEGKDSRASLDRTAEGGCPHMSPGVNESIVLLASRRPDAVAAWGTPAEAATVEPIWLRASLWQRIIEVAKVCNASLHLLATFLRFSKYLSRFLYRGCFKSRTARYNPAIWFRDRVLWSATLQPLTV
jgi:hypothetical protein